jgi:hypothetical protein
MECTETYLHPTRYKQSKSRDDRKNKRSEQRRRNRNYAEGGIYNGGLQLKFARTGTEVLSIGQRLQDRARVSTVDTREGDVVTAPVDFNALVLQGEDDQSGNGDAAVEGSGGDAEGLSAQNSQSGVGGYSLVVLGPPPQVTSPDVVVEDVGDRDGGPNIGHVVRCPAESTTQEEGNVEVGKDLELLAEEVEGDGQDST